MRKVLIVEDDEAMSVALRDGFTYEGYTVTVAKDGEAGLHLATTAVPDLILLDVMLPKLTGLDICRKLRTDGSAVPIIMLTARGQEIDKVLGLKQGADDYVTKPFGFMELMARVEAVLRRCTGPNGNGHAGAAEAVCRFGDVTVDFRSCEGWKGSRSIDLSPRELKLLAYFLQHRGEVISRETLLDTVWDYNAVLYTRTVDMHIAKLRKKIEDNPGDPKHIVTVHRLGYKFTG
jgi:two-component system, OmpR family, alkaline phosphatase synthesis response regulator PhoP